MEESTNTHLKAQCLVLPVGRTSHQRHLNKMKKVIREGAEEMHRDVVSYCLSPFPAPTLGIPGSIELPEKDPPKDYK